MPERTPEEKLKARRQSRAEYERKLRAEKPEVIAARSKTWRERNREKYLASARARTAAYRAKHPEKVRAKTEEWRAKNLDYLRCKRLQKTFGLTLEEWNLKLAAQNFRCDCCGGEDPRHKRGWQTDHDHHSGALRGLLCGPCNIVLTYQLTQEKLEQMRLYLIKYGSI